MRALIAIAILFSSVAATAGSITVTDRTGTLSSTEFALLRNDNGQWPFNTKVLMDSFPSKRAVEAAAHDCITTPNDVCIVVDPGHRFTSTHFGTGTGVRPSDYSLVAAAGNSRFKVGDWRGGIDHRKSLAPVVHVLRNCLYRIRVLGRASG